MRRSREAAARTRVGAVEAASRLVRARGIDGVSVAEVMGAVEQTVGGFYRHFESKDALVAEAIDCAARGSGAALEAARDEAGAGQALAAVAGYYLHPKHRRHREQGCAVAALACEMPRHAGPARAAFDRALEGLVRIVASAAPAEGREAALHRVAALVGAVVLARAASDRALGDEVAEAVRGELLRGRTAAPPTRPRRAAPAPRPG